MQMSQPESSIRFKLISFSNSISISQVTEAYEVLGSDEKRKLYDMNRKRTFEEMKHHRRFILSIYL